MVREHFCDGLGDCLPECPTGAISFEEREAPAYDEEAVKEAQKKVFAKNQAMSRIIQNERQQSDVKMPLRISVRLLMIGEIYS